MSHPVTIGDHSVAMTIDTLKSDVLAFVQDQEDRDYVAGLLEKLEELAHDEGYDFGHNAGLDEADSAGYDEDSYNGGYQDGLADGRAEAEAEFDEAI